MKIYSVDEKGNFILKKAKTVTSGKVLTKKALFALCYQINSENEIELVISSPKHDVNADKNAAKSGHRAGIQEAEIIKQLFGITELDGIPVEVMAGSVPPANEPGFGFNPPTEGPKPPQSPPGGAPPGSAVLSDEEMETHIEPQRERNSFEMR